MSAHAHFVYRLDDLRGRSACGPIRQQRLFAIVERHPCGLPRAWGGRCSEVKEEGWAKPGPGDMSESGHPRAAARADAGTRAAAKHSFVTVRNGPRAAARKPVYFMHGGLHQECGSH